MSDDRIEKGFIKMPVCVYVNTNTPITGGFIPVAHAHYGHAALGFINIEGIAGVSDFYISWYPTSDRQENAYKMNYRNGKVAAARAVKSGIAARVEPVKDFWSEPQKFRSHVNKVFIPCQGEIPGAPGVGLNAKRMEQWWNLSKDNVMSKFELISKSKNCAGTVMSALWAGGSETYESYRRVVWVSPRDVLSYAKSIRKQINKAAKLVNEASNLLQMQQNQAVQLSSKEQKKVTKFQSLTNKTAAARPAIQDEGSTVNDCGKYDLMNVQHWTQLSKVEMSWSTGFARRKEQIKNIDQKLAEYHEKSWKTDYARKALLLVEMLQEVRDHMTHKADSKRANAVMILAGQLMSVFNSIDDYSKIHQDELAKLRKKEAEIAYAIAEANRPQFVLTEQEKLLRKVMILLKKNYECARFVALPDMLRMQAQSQAMMYKSPNFATSAKKDDQGNILVTQANIDAIPDEWVADEHFDVREYDFE